MIEFLQLNFVPVLFVGLLVFLVIGFPVAFSLAARPGVWLLGYGGRPLS